MAILNINPNAAPYLSIPNLNAFNALAPSPSKASMWSASGLSTTGTISAVSGSFVLNPNAANIVMTGSLFSPVAAFGTPPENILKKYPATNKKYMLVMKSLDGLAYVLGIKSLDTHLYKEMDTLLPKINRDILFVGKLREVRIHTQSPELDLSETPDYALDGHVYDPWFRDISSLGAGKYDKIYHGKIAAHVGNSFTKHLVLWLYDTTLDGTPVSILIYDYVDVYYANNVKTGRFYTTIDPYSVKTDMDYRLLA
jgi:hypothetical protein